MTTPIWERASREQLGGRIGELQVERDEWRADYYRELWRAERLSNACFAFALACVGLVGLFVLCVTT